MNKFSFLILNIIMGSNLLKYPIFIMIFFLWIMGDGINLAISSSNWFKIVSFCSAALFLCFWILKIFIFIFLFKKSKKGTYAYDFFRKFRDDEKFQDNIMLKSLLSDTLFFTLEAIIFFVIRLLSESDAEFFNFIAGTFIVWLITGTGTLLNYFSLSLWLNRRKEVKN